MSDAMYLWLAALAALAGMAWLALSLDVHWRQVVGPRASRATFVASALRFMGAVGLVVSLIFCLRADHASMAVLVWMMLLTASAFSVAMALTWRPLLLRFLLLPCLLGAGASNR